MYYAVPLPIVHWGAQCFIACTFQAFALFGGLQIHCQYVNALPSHAFSAAFLILLLEVFSYRTLLSYIAQVPDP